MSHYWARFRPHGNSVLRFDTRIYLHERRRPGARDRALGSIIGKNPGSALPASDSTELQPIALQGDHFLPTVRAMVSKACAGTDLADDDRAYVQVLNLFYLCDRDLRQAKASLSRQPAVVTCDSERKRVPWTWFAWGGPDPLLDPLKARFLKRRRHCFYFCNESQAVVARIPAPDDKARHTQGMPHEPIVRHLRSTVCA